MEAEVEHGGESYLVHYTKEEFEKKYTAVHCYMNQTGASKMDTFAELRKQVANAWKDMNQECLHPTVPVSMLILKPVVDLARVIHLLYSDNDDYTNSQTNTRDYINSVLVEPVPI
ncbi:UNVERIFIED_CONTAM: Beta-caryophyllene synthase [Sesamum angustifolium]|uniref:Beta-caryophyllene synthase n=1 Tax=Sesamum angustifolium TaxID=2727405 RepID=A0AAW2PCF1_9LAMI